VLAVTSALDGSWIDKGNILVGAMGRPRMRREVHSLEEFGGWLEIREREDEVTFLDYLAVEFLRNGRWEACHPKAKQLSRADNKFMMLRKGDYFRTVCDVEGAVEIKLVIQGYYDLLADSRPSRIGPQ
jgi:hypothetical protein